MRIQVVQKILGLFLSLFSLTLVPPLLIALWVADGMATAFAIAIAVILTSGLMLWIPVRTVEKDLKLRDGFLVVASFWIVLGLMGSIPFLVAEHPDISTVDAIFESISGLTTTGATVIVGLDRLPPSILFYRQLLQWLGGMGIIVLAVAIVPMLGIGGMQLYRAETPGPLKDAKLTPRITETAKALWYIYLALTVGCCLAYLAAGMSLFDAIGHSFSTIAIGGFSTHDASIGFFKSPVIETVAIIFMFIAGINFALHFMAWRYRNLKPYFYDAEFRMYAGLLISVFLISVTALTLAHETTSVTSALRYGLFHTVSIGTTTGFSTTNFQVWSGFLPLLLVFLSFAGGCAGSTGGGLKVIRVLLLYKQGVREIRRLIHPKAIITIHMGDRPVDDRVVQAVWGFFATYVAVFVLLQLALMATGLDQITSFSAVAACLNNLGPGLGDVSGNYASISPVAKYLLCLAMVLGRLEIFTLLVLFTPSFWRP